SYALHENYPNPFNPVTTVEFALPERSNVELVVYDVLGREVARLADGEYEAGRYRVSFDADRLSSGIYFCRMKAGSFESVQKLVLMK
ncbi:MAG: T9SS type A sorting domain-containing protein, partial [bacterium]